MRRLLKRWGALGGSTLLGLLIGLGSGWLARHDATTRGDEHQDGRLAAVELWQGNHDVTVKPLVQEMQTLHRNFDGFLTWFRAIARSQGWPEPPAAVKRVLPEPPGAGTYAAETPERQRSQK